MRIIAGEFRGRTIKAPKGDGTRPTSDRVRESMMSVVYSARGGFDGAAVLDAFAGSGALGLEALSRGARSVLFCECASEAVRVLRENVAALGLDERRARVQKSDVLSKPPSARLPFDLVFLDPPYACAPEVVVGLIGALRASGALGDKAMVVYEHAVGANAEVEQAAKACDLSIALRKKYGDTVVDVLHQTTPAARSAEKPREWICP